MRKIAIILLLSLHGCKKMDILNNSKYYLWHFSGKNVTAKINAKYHISDHFSNSDTIAIGSLLYHSDSILIFECPVFKGLEIEFKENIKFNLNVETKRIVKISFIDKEQYHTERDTSLHDYDSQYSSGYYFGYKSPEPELVNIAHSFYGVYKEDVQANKYNFDYEIVHHIKNSRTPLLRHSTPKGGHDFYVVKDKKTNRKVWIDGAPCHIYLYKNKFLLVSFDYFGGFDDISVGLIDLSEYFKNSK